MCIRMPMTSDARSKRPGADAMRSKNSCTLKDTGAPRRVQLHQFAALIRTGIRVCRRTDGRGGRRAMGTASWDEQQTCPIWNLSRGGIWSWWCRPRVPTCARTRLPPPSLPPSSTSAMSSFEKAVKGACKPKPMPPKAKYMDPILAATWSEDGAVHDVCRALIPRFREPNVTVVFKALIVLHMMMRNGSTDNVLSYLSSSDVLRLKSIASVSWEGMFYFTCRWCTRPLTAPRL